jgi:hypothetical protein
LITIRQSLSFGAMTQHRSVNETLDGIATLHSQPVEVEGILDASFEGSREGYELLHYPKVERREEGVEGGLACHWSLWLEFGHGSIQPNRLVLDRWKGKRVRVHGVVHASKTLQASWTAVDPLSIDPWGIWRAHLEVHSIQRVTSGQRRESGA